MRTMESVRIGVHENAGAGDHLEAQVVAKRDHLRRFRALLQPDVLDAGRRRVTDDVERLVRRHDHEDGVDALDRIDDAGITAHGADSRDARMNRIDAISFDAQFAACNVSETSAVPRHADHRDRGFGDERGDPF